MYEKLVFYVLFYFEFFKKQSMKVGYIVYMFVFEVECNIIEVRTRENGIVVKEGVKVNGK